MKFYINKYPIVTLFNCNDEANETIPEGTVFTIEGISHQGYVLKPVKKTECTDSKHRAILDFSPEILKSAFTECDYLPD
tara:strand:- start:83 stop:319 length:237 start_codon:yes stop_codon:yes gene_type:complete